MTRNGQSVLWTMNKKEHPDVSSKCKARVYDGISGPDEAHFHFCDGSINTEKSPEILEQHAAFKTTSFPGTSMYFSTWQYKTTFCEHYKDMTEEDDGIATGLTCQQS